MAAEHRLAQLGIRQARYFGRIKTRFQLYQAATVANLTQLDAKVGLTGDTDDVGSGDNAFFAKIAHAAANLGAIRLGQLWSLTFLTSALLPNVFCSTRAFRPDF